MKKIQPSERIGQEINELLTNGCQESEDLLSLLIRKAITKIIQETLEQEIANYLGRDYYQHNSAARKGYRNGYEPRTLKSAEGKITIAVPQLRNTETTYHSAFLKRFGTSTAELEWSQDSASIRIRKQRVLSMLARFFSPDDRSRTQNALVSD